MAQQEDGHEAAYETGLEQDLNLSLAKGYCNIVRLPLLQHWYLVSYLVQHYHIYVWQIWHQVQPCCLTEGISLMIICVSQPTGAETVGTGVQ